jgi:hypothetical protein
MLFLLGALLVGAAATLLSRHPALWFLLVASTTASPVATN